MGLQNVHPLKINQKLDHTSTQTEYCRWLLTQQSPISHGAVPLTSRCTILNAVLLYNLDEPLSN